MHIYIKRQSGNKDIEADRQGDREAGRRINR